MNLPRRETLKRELFEMGIVHLLIVVLVLAVLLFSSRQSLFSGKGIKLPVATEGLPAHYTAR